MMVCTSSGRGLKAPARLRPPRPCAGVQAPPIRLPRGPGRWTNQRGPSHDSGRCWNRRGGYTWRPWRQGDAEHGVSFFCVSISFLFFPSLFVGPKMTELMQFKNFDSFHPNPQSPTFWGLGKFLNLAPPKWIQVKTASTRQKHVRQVAAAWHLTIRARGQQQTNLAIFRLCCLCTQTLPLWTDTHIFICWKPPADSGRPLFTFQHFGILRKQKRVLFAVISPTYVLTNCKSII